MAPMKHEKSMHVLGAFSRLHGIAVDDLEDLDIREDWKDYQMGIGDWADSGVIRYYQNGTDVLLATEEFKGIPTKVTFTEEGKKVLAEELLKVIAARLGVSHA